MKNHICSVWVVEDPKYGVMYSCHSKKMANEWYECFGSISSIPVDIYKLRGNKKRTKYDGLEYASQEEVEKWMEGK